MDHFYEKYPNTNLMSQFQAHREKSGCWSGTQDSSRYFPDALPHLENTQGLVPASPGSFPRKPGLAPADPGPRTADQEALIPRSGPRLLGDPEPILAWLEEPAQTCQTPDRHRLAPIPLAEILEMEKPPQGTWEAEDPHQCDRVDPQNVPRKPELGSGAHPG
jgi:hypothetical protein